MKNNKISQQSIGQINIVIINKFPERYRFQLTKNETLFLRSKKSTSDIWAMGNGGRAYLPYAFTEQGIDMLMTVL